jgi:hypothetical protein
MTTPRTDSDDIFSLENDIAYPDPVTNYEFYRSKSGDLLFKKPELKIHSSSEDIPDKISDSDSGMEKQLEDIKRRIGSLPDPIPSPRSEPMEEDKSCCSCLWLK